MQYAEEAATARKASRVSLHVWAENLVAISFYERSGYHRLRAIPDYYAPGSHAWLYSKQLTKASLPAIGA